LVPDKRLVRWSSGAIGFATSKVPGEPVVNVGLLGLTDGQLGQIQRGAAADMWLDHTDPIGPAGRGIVVQDGRAVRTDMAGALLFDRGGAFKTKLTTRVDDFDDTAIAKGRGPLAAEVFAGVSDAAKAEAIRGVLAVTDEEIRRIVDETISHPHWAEVLTDMLIQRRDALAEHIPPSQITGGQGADKGKAKAVHIESEDEAEIVAA
jgi:hypothetical protein